MERVADKQQGNPPRKRENSRERIIDAAIDLCCTEGIRRLSLEAVAERAGLSKGGLLYNFGSKSALLQAMVSRHIDAVSVAVDNVSRELARDQRPNLRIRAYLTALRCLLAREGKKPAGFLAAISEEPELLDPVREHHARLVRELLEESENPDIAILAFFASEGMRSLRLFETNPFTDEALIGYLDRMIELLGQVAPAADGKMAAE